MRKLVLKSYEETLMLGRKIGKQLHGGDVVALYGGLGAGKTALTKGIAQGLGCNDYVTSPTFSLVSQYECDNVTLCHFDMYRITDDENLYSIGYYDMLRDDCVAVIEWSENIEFAIPDNAKRIYLEYGNDESERIISFDF